MSFPNERAPAAVNGRGAGNSGERFHAQNASAEALLQRLDAVQKSGNGWRSKCPACGGRSQKLAIAERDGRVLVHCFAGCRAEDVIHAVGLTWADLHPPRHWPQSPEERRAAGRAIRDAGMASALSVLALEARVALIAARQLARWQSLNVEDDARLNLAVERIEGAAALLVEANRWRPPA